MLSVIGIETYVLTGTGDIDTGASKIGQCAFALNRGDDVRIR
uniref:Uncharacterized protein n=1 Tax=Vibrio splendidus TaxID=29497 RepID=A0A0H3ZQ97_VIBSP|nr:hypothetical protein [Vibrio splendidus]